MDILALLFWRLEPVPKIIVKFQKCDQISEQSDLISTQKVNIKGERNTKFKIWPDWSNLLSENSQAGQLENKMVSLKTICFFLKLA